MNLSEEEKKKVEEEEAYRLKIREKERYRAEVRGGYQTEVRKTKTPWWKPTGKPTAVGIVFVILVWSVVLFNFLFLGLSNIISLDFWNSSDTNSNEPLKTSTQSTEQEGGVKTQHGNNFQDLSRKRFDGILANAPELTEIECLNGDCTSVVYFHFKTLPDDLEFMIRANTVTFSNFKYQQTGTSHVSIFATYNNRVVLQCNGAKGVVSDCK